mgnify:CR=1 FL=1
MPQGSEPIIRDFLANNAYMLKQLIEKSFISLLVQDFEIFPHEKIPPV